MMNEIANIADIALGIICLIGCIVGVVAWVKRGFGIPRLVHVMAGILFVVGSILAFIAFKTGSTGFYVFALLGFPAWAYAGWFFMGCPDGTRRQNPERYDISAVLEDKRKK